MVVARKPYSDNEQAKLHTYSCETVEDYTYFVTILTHKNDLRLEIAKRITNAYIAYYALLPVQTVNQYSELKKIKMCKTSGNILSRIFDTE